MGFVLILGVLVALIWVVVKSNLAFNWHNRGVGERKGKAAYARLKRERPDDPDARLGEAEFVEKFVAARPGVGRYILMAVGLFVMMPVACVVAM